MPKIPGIINLFCLLIISSSAIFYVYRVANSNDNIISPDDKVIPVDDSWSQLEMLEFHQDNDKSKATIYYVDHQNGNDKNQGTDENSPFKTIGKANKLVESGDIVYVKNGSYKENITITTSGEPKKWITFQAYPGHKPFVQGTQDGTFRVEGNYIKIIGFEITSTRNGSGIHIGDDYEGDGIHHVQIINNEIRDSGCGGISGVRTDYLYIEGNTVYRNAFRSRYQCSGISIYQAQAFDNKPGFHNIIRGNISYGNENKRLRKDGTVTDGNGIIIDDFRHTQQNSDIENYKPWTLVENNIVFDNGGRGIHVFFSDNVVVRNNTAFHNLKSENLDGHLNGELTTLFSSDVHFYNNIAYTRDKSKKTLVDDYSQENKWDYNISYQGQPLVNDGNSDVVLGKNNLIDVDPLFVKPSINPQIANFQLQANSKARNSGTGKISAKIDFNQKNRPLENLYDIGAYEFLPARLKDQD